MRITDSQWLSLYAQLDANSANVILLISSLKVMRRNLILASLFTEYFNIHANQEFYFPVPEGTFIELGTSNTHSKTFLIELSV